MAPYNPDIAVRKRSSANTREAVLVERLESSSQPHIFQFLSITDGSEALRLHKEYRGNLVWLMYRALTEWFASSDVKILKHPQGRSCQSRYLSTTGKFTNSSGVYFLEANGVRAALTIYLRNIGYQELHLSFYVRTSDAPSIHSVLTDIENTPSRLKNLILDGEGVPLASFPPVSWTDVVLPEEMRRLVNSNSIDLLGKSDLYRRMGVPLKRGLLFWGSPGCGKTLCAKMLMSQFPRSIYVTCGDLDSCPGWGIPEIYGLARRLAPCLVVLEDLDVLGGVERRSQSGRPLGQLLGELDGLESNQGVVTVATTNDVAVLDEALNNRPGRFDIKLHFPNPGHDLRMQLLKLFTKSVTLAPDVDLTTLSNRMEYGNLSAAHVREVVTRSIIFATDEVAEFTDTDPVVSQSHLERALTIMADPKRGKIGFNPERG
ncbi:MAG: hypothetical protein A2X35_11640 [Elusimicrobia bacterium GWA2_61_42]|nr:MAG: hypothetical protein A2X35_11640 [Elusimicrobia bacterium GWA2_61_42]OGR75813.1 MAG: hypothetical protein A2X38_07275 [Elusimicrobia bacterium GWC2_61_25]